MLLRSEAAQIARGIADTALCDRVLSALTAIDDATGDAVHADGQAIAKKVRPFLNAGVCKYLKAKKKVMLAQKRKASQAFARDAVRDIERILRARKG